MPELICTWSVWLLNAFFVKTEPSLSCINSMHDSQSSSDSRRRNSPEKFWKSVFALLKTLSNLSSDQRLFKLSHFTLAKIHWQPDHVNKLLPHPFWGNVYYSYWNVPIYCYKYQASLTGETSQGNTAGFHFISDHNYGVFLWYLLIYKYSHCAWKSRQAFRETMKSVRKHQYQERESWELLCQE